MIIGVDLSLQKLYSELIRWLLKYENLALILENVESSKMVIGDV